MTKLVEETTMRKLLNQSWLPLLCLLALASFVPATHAGNVNFSCSGNSATPVFNQCSGTVTVNGPADWVSDGTGITVWNTNGPFGTIGSPSLLTLTFDTGAGWIIITDGAETLVGAITSITSGAGSTTANINIIATWDLSAAPSVAAQLGTPGGLDNANITIQTTAGNQVTDVSITITPTPEPTTMILFGSGLLAGAGYLRRKRKK